LNKILAKSITKMKFLQFIGLLIIHFFICIICLAQRELVPREVDSLKQLLPLTQDSVRVDCLNELGDRYSISLNSLHQDTGIIYLDQAYNEAVRINYTKGIATALMHRGGMELIRHRYSIAEQYVRKAIPYFKKMQDSPPDSGHHALGFVLNAQGHFDEALAEYQAVIHFFQKPYSERERMVIRTSLEFLGCIYGYKGDLEKGFELAQKGLAESEQKNDSLGIAFSLRIFGDLYQSMDDHHMALEYYHASIAMGGKYDPYLSLPIAAVHNAMQHYDSALYYHQRTSVKDPAGPYVQIVLGEIYLNQKKYHEALQIFKRVESFLKKNNGRKDLLRLFPDMAKVYLALGNYPASLYYAKNGLALGQATGARHYIANGFKLLATIYEMVGDNKRSYAYLQQYIKLKDSLLSDQFKAKLFAYRSKVENEKKQTQIGRLNKEKQISQQQLKIQQQQLQQASLLKKILIGGILAFVLLGIILFRNLILKQRNEKLKSERTQAILQHKTVELEMQALRAQMNPHFIFNCLSSINRFILKNESEAASDYLTKFSRLIRMVLLNSKQTFISLQDELETLRLYLEMERLRFPDAFDYNISLVNDIDPESIFIPPLLLQPFAENAIWHGLMHKQGQGHLDIELSLHGKILTSTITDNGIGRSKADRIKSKSTEKQKSMGLQITTERLALLNHDSNVKTFFTIQDLTDDSGEPAGTQVILKIHFRDMVETPVEFN
jgi:tetratricopeptide (TPR) repeat protein